MATAARKARAHWTAERQFYTAIAIAIFLAAYVGFAPTFFLRPLFPDRPAPTEPFFLLHGALFAAWCVLLVVQASLINLGRVELHRRLGTWGAVLAAAMVAAGVFVRKPFVAPQDRCIRVTVGREAELDAFEAALPLALEAARYQ